MLSLAAATTTKLEPMIMYRILATAAAVSLIGAVFAMPAVAEPETAREQVWAAENAFAQTMRERNLEAFSDFIADEAVFFAGTTVLRGRSKVIEGWAQYFNGMEAPFSWEPDQVEVLESGSLALSTGPVRDPTGKVVARFNSIWRFEAPNGWKVVFDKGSPASPGPP